MQKITKLIGLFIANAIAVMSFAQPANFEAFISRAQGNRISFVFNTINQIQNGITSTYTTQFGLNLLDGDGFGVGSEYTQLYLRVSTDDNAISSLDGANTLPLSALRISTAAIAGFDGTNGETNTFSTPITPTGGGVQDNLLISDLPAFQAINYADHRVEITFEVGTINPINTEEAGFYIVNLDFWLYGCGDWNGGVGCPP